VVFFIVVEIIVTPKRRGWFSSGGENFEEKQYHCVLDSLFIFFLKQFKAVLDHSY